MAARVVFAEGSQCNCTFQVGAEPISMIAKLHTIAEALLCSPVGVNVCVATDSKSSIEGMCGWHMCPLGRASSLGTGVIEHFQPK